MGTRKVKSRAYAVGQDGSTLTAFSANVTTWGENRIFIGIIESGLDGTSSAAYLSADDAITYGAELIALAAQLRDREGR